MHKNEKGKTVMIVTLIALLTMIMTMRPATARETGETPRLGLLSQMNLTPEQREWLKATPEQRRTLGEQIGERGGRTLAKEMGLEPIFDGISGKTIPQGADQVYRTKTGRIAVFETKANSSPKNMGYGYVQGSIEHTLKSAEYVLKSPRSSEAQKRAAKAILKAAAEGKLDVYIVRTFHVQGKVTKTIIEQVVRCTKAHQAMAKSIIDALAKSGIHVYGNGRKNLPATSTSAVKAPKSTRKTKTVTKQMLAPKNLQNMSNTTSIVSKAFRGLALSAGAVLDGGFRSWHGYKVEQEHNQGIINDNERLVAHGENIAGCAGGWGGAVAGGKGGAMAGAALGSFFGPIGTGVGSVTGGICGAVGGYMAGDAVGAAGARLVLQDR